MLNRVGNIFLMSVFVLAALSCNKHDVNPDTPEQKTLINFSAQSESVLTKSKNLNGDFSISDFGVWGIARKALHQDYILWYPTTNTDNTYALEKVDYSSTVTAEDGTKTENFVPENAAYWFSGFTYNFIAIAPYAAAQSVSSITSGDESGKEQISFDYSLASSYAESAYAPELMGAVAEKSVGVSATHPSEQGLIFWHLFSKININISFGEDADGEQMVGEVHEVRLQNIDAEGQYTLSFAEDKSMVVACTTSTEAASQKTATFGTDYSTLHILPQNISDFRMFIDFELGDVTFTDYELSLAGATEKNYGYNQQYNWNITIGPKETIKFDVTVTDWVTDTSLPSIDIK